MPRTQEQFNQMKDEARQKIMSAALCLFSHKGLSATSIVDIAKKAGVSSGLLYHYFRSKEELFSELVGFAVASSGGFIEEIAGLGLGSAEKIRRISAKMIETLKEDDTTAQYFVLMVKLTLEGDLNEKTTENAKEAAKPVIILSGIIAQGQSAGEVKSGNPYEMAILYWAAVQGLCSYKLVMGENFMLPSAELLSGILIN